MSRSEGTFNSTILENKKNVSNLSFFIPRYVCLRLVNYVAFNIGIVLAGFGSILMLVGIVILNTQINKLKSAVTTLNGTLAESVQLKSVLAPLEKILRYREYALVAWILGLLLIVGGLLAARSSLAPTA